MALPQRDKKTGIYEFRRAIPEALRKAAGGKWEYKRSLRTKDIRTAKRLYPDVAAACDEYFSELRAKQRATVAASTAPQSPEASSQAVPEGTSRAALLSLAAELGDQTVADNAIPPEHAYALNRSAPSVGAWGGPRDPWTGQRFLLTMGRRERVPAIEQSSVRETARAFLSARNVTLSADDLAAFCELAREALDDAYATLQRTHRGEDSGGSGKSFRERFAISAQQQEPTPTRAKVPFKDLLQGWQRERKPRTGTVETYRTHLEQFARFLKHDDAARVVPDDVVSWKDSLLASGKLADKTIREKHLAALKAVFGWAKENRKLASNPAQGITVKSKAPPRGRSKGFTDEEAHTILRASLRVGDDAQPRTKESARRWIPWLCCYSGARVSEIAQLRSTDIQQEAGVWTMVLTPEAGSIKSDQFRKVPLHPHLIAQGFLAFVKRAGEGPLFYSAARTRKTNPRKPPAQTVANKLAAWVRGTGVTDKRVAPNHGWRHRFATECRRHGVSEGAEMALKGHAPATVGASYGDWPVEVLARELGKIPAVTLAPPNRKGTGRKAARL